MLHKAEPQEAIQHDQEQLDIALQASYEAESILHHMLRNASIEPEHAWIKAFVLRLNAINSVCMSALSGKDFDTTAHMRKMFEGH